MLIVPLLSYACFVVGCSMVVGNLWDVTDKDIDRFCVSALQRMTTTFKEGEERKKDKKKKGKKKKTKGKRAKQSEEVEEDVVDVLRTVALARNDCKMKYLIGAAPVCYGVPVVVRCTARVHCRKCGVVHGVVWSR